ncbi:MAG: hypothetical protein HYZ42_12090, partial [Bacteroidetes bacterium]|nr:hypothetical protein [Bacteroidota bacterium]
MKKANLFAFWSTIISTTPYFLLGWNILAILIFALSFCFLFLFYTTDLKPTLIKYLTLLNMCLLNIVVCTLLDMDIHMRYMLLPATILIFHMFTDKEIIHRTILLVILFCTFTYFEIFGVCDWFVQYQYRVDFKTFLILKKIYIILSVIAIIFQTIQLNKIRDQIMDSYRHDIKFKTALNNLLAHDLRVPISNIQKLTHLLKKETDNQMKNELTEMLAQSADKSINIINDLLYISKLENTKKIYKDRVEIVGLTQEASDSLSSQALSKNINISLTSTKKEMYIQAESAMFKRVLDNIISNAIKFSHKGSKVEITITEKAGFNEIIFKDYGVAHLQAWGVPAAQIHDLEWWKEESLKGVRIVSTPSRH